ncbi:MAG: radical SAM family heme chaperone HemW [Bradymonadia bacterium]
MGFGLYVHYPFCRRVCPYCDFCVETSKNADPDRYSEALLRELERRAPMFDEFGLLETIYIGGGTPSLWTVSSLKHWLEVAARRFPTASNLEITLEVNPEDVSLDLLHGWYDVGINRLSVGAQSLNDKFLQQLGRGHSGEHVEQCIRWIQTAGYRNWNVDLIHGMVGQTLAESLLDVKRVIDLGTPHLSTYQLTIEENTRFGQRARRGEQLNVEDGMLASMYQGIVDLNEAHGRRQYEVSNAAFEGFESRHNLGYWLGKPYLALGVGAHGFAPSGDGGIRYANAPGVSNYVGAMFSPNPGQGIPCEISEFGQSELMEDLLMTGLRLRDGIKPSAEMTRVYANRVDSLCKRGLMRKTSQCWQVTSRGRAVLDHVLEQLLS